jgi:AhpC/TSA family
MGADVKEDRAGDRGSSLALGASQATIGGWQLSTQQLAQAPDFTLDHALGHQVSFSQFRGQKIALIFCNRDTAGQIKQAINTIRRGLPEDQATIISIFDMRGVPKPARRLVKGKLKKGYEEQMADVAALGLGGGINMLVDWSGSVVDSYGVALTEQAIAAAIDPWGRIVGWGAGEQLGTQIVAILSAVQAA